MKPRQLVGLALLATMAAVAGLMIYRELEVDRIRREYPPVGQVAPADGMCLHYVPERDGQPAQ